MHSEDIAAAKALSRSAAMQEAIRKGRKIWLDAAGRGPETAMEERLLTEDMQNRAFYVALIAQNNDPANPRVTQFGWRAIDLCGAEIPATGMTVNNQDNVYYHIPINGSYTYILKGRAPEKGPLDFSFKLADSWPNMVTVDTLAGAELVTNEADSFDITISSEKSADASNRLQSLPGKEQSLMIRETLGNWSVEQPHLYCVERIKHPEDTEVVSEQASAEKAASLYIKYITDMTRIMRRWVGYPVNAFGEIFNSALGGGLAVQLNAEGQYDLPPDEALVVTIDPGGAAYFNIQMIDPWLADIEAEDRIGELNNTQSRKSADGTYRFVISQRDPGIYNWLNVGDIPKGFLYTRFQGFPTVGTPNAKSDDYPSIAVMKVKFSELETLFADDTVSAQERRQQLEERAQGYIRRFNRSE